jgi:hypothetical protein
MRKFVVPQRTVYLPREGRDVRSEGETVEVTGYIERLIKDGSLVVKIPETPKEIKQEETV